MTFKENWEKAHARVPLSNELILKILGTYYAEDHIKSASVIEGGCANINVLVHLKSSDIPVILRIYLRDQDSAYREQKISTLLEDKVPVPKFYHVAQSCGHTFAITEYLPGKPLRDFLTCDPRLNMSEIMVKVGKVLGCLSNITFANSGFFNKNLEVEKSTTREELVNFCFESLKHPRVKAAIPLTQREQIKAIFKSYKNLLPDESAKNLVHADFDPANILVTEKEGVIEISGILDWEFSFSGSTLWDIANMLRYAHQVPRDYKDSFLEGVSSTGYQLPDSWQITITLLNMASLLDSLQRTPLNDRPNQVKDIQDLMSHMVLPFAPAP